MTLQPSTLDALASAGLDPAYVEALVTSTVAEDLDGGVDVTSTATVPESRAASERPASWAIGARPARRACPQSTRFAESPRARADCTNGAPSRARTGDLTKRAVAAAAGRPSAAAGRARCQTRSRPRRQSPNEPASTARIAPGGKSGSATAKPAISIRPSQKAGSDHRAREMPRSAWSNGDPARAAAATPSASPSPSSMSSAAPESRRVFGAVSRRISPTGRCWLKE